jgi:hypothetical protein
MADSDTSYDSDDERQAKAGGPAVAEAEARQAALERERDALQAAELVPTGADSGVKRRSLKMDNDEVRTTPCHIGLLQLLFFWLSFCNGFCVPTLYVCSPCTCC